MYRKRMAYVSFICILAILITSCKSPSAFQPQSNFDTSTLTCDNLAQAREDAQKAYQATLSQLSKAYVEAYDVFQGGLAACLKPIWQSGPCDQEWTDVQNAYASASADISNDELYNNYRQASQNWKDCRAKDVDLDDWRAKNLKAEEACRDEFNLKWDAAQKAYYDAKDAAKQKYDADMAAIDEFEKKCKDKPSGGGTGTTGGVDGGSVGGGSNGGTSAGGTSGGGTTTYEPNSGPCNPEIPGENAKPRQGKSTDFGPKDIIINVATQAAEEVTGTVIPTSAINDQIFAGIVCARLHSRITELYDEWAEWNMQGRSRLANLWERKIKRYEAARDVWCKIAEGRPPIQIKEQVQVIQDMPSGGCAVDADCGVATCCDAATIGNPHCNTNNGACSGTLSYCPSGQTCAGKPAACFSRINVIAYGGKYLPVSQLHRFTGDVATECNMEEHWHANDHVVKATDGSMVSDPGNCGFGKTKSTPVIQIDAPIQDSENGKIIVTGLDQLKQN